MGCSISYEEINQVLKTFQYLKPKVFLETGTQFGNTIFPMSKHFDKLYTIELSEQHYKNAIKKSNDLKIENIEFVNGDSGKLISVCLKKIKDQAIFFLDGHHCGFSTDPNATRGEVEAPLYQEVESIDKIYNDDCLIIIDDSRLFGKKLPDKDVDWSDITVEGLLSKIKQNKIISHFEFNDRYWIFLRKI